MSIYAAIQKENKSHAAAGHSDRPGGIGRHVAALTDNRQQATVQRKLVAGMNEGPQVQKAVQLQAMADDYTARTQTVQAVDNRKSLPGPLKSGIENLSGISMGDVRVHYNSSQPAQLQAHAYAQGSDIHIAPGQEKHLPHEAWHVVQQKQGRVQPTKQLKSKININDDKGLEQEADIMGAKSLTAGGNTTNSLQKKTITRKQPAQLSVWNYIFGARGQEWDDMNELKQNATPAQVQQLQQYEQNGTMLLKLFKAEESHSTGRILQLLATGITAAQALRLLIVFESNALRLVELINREANHSIRWITALYEDDFTTLQIIALMRVWNSASFMHNCASTRGPFRLDRLLYCSINDDGNTGSIYFRNGRIRLAHDQGPAVEVHDDVERYSLPQQAMAQFKLWWYRHFGGPEHRPPGKGTVVAVARRMTCREYVNNELGIRRQTRVGDNGYILEIRTGSPHWMHPSQGRARDFNYEISQRDLNLLQNFIRQRASNDELRALMGAVESLKAVPLR